VIKGWLHQSLWSVGLLFCFLGPVLLAAEDPCITLGLPVRNNGQVQFQLSGEPGVTYIIESSSHLQSWVPVWTNVYAPLGLVAFNSSDEQAFFRVVRGPLPRFAGALTAEQNINFKGNSIRIDSYDSMDPNYSTNGIYDPAKRKAGGDLASAGIIEISNANIHGKVRTSPLGSYTIGPNGFAGDLAWTGPGVQPGWYSNDFRWCFPDAKLPAGFSGITPTGAGTNLYVLGHGDYVLTNLSLGNSQNVLVSGFARLLVLENLVMSGTATIQIEPGAKLEIYMAGTNAGLTAVNVEGRPNMFAYFGLPTNTNVTWSPNQKFVGTIYAPQAHVEAGGGGSTFMDFQGACLAKSIQLLSAVDIHYDEALKRLGPMR
jgi:hypothetical protein